MWLWCGQKRGVILEYLVVAIVSAVWRDGGLNKAGV